MVCWFFKVQVLDECTSRIAQAGDGHRSFEGGFSNLQGHGVSRQLVSSLDLIATRLKLEISSAHLRCHLLRGKRVSLVCSKSGIIADTSTAVGDNAVALLEAADLRADFDDRARK